MGAVLIMISRRFSSSSYATQAGLKSFKKWKASRRGCFLSIWAQWQSTDARKKSGTLWMSAEPTRQECGHTKSTSRFPFHSTQVHHQTGHSLLSSLNTQGKDRTAFKQTWTALCAKTSIPTAYSVHIILFSGLYSATLNAVQDAHIILWL